MFPTRFAANLGVLDAFGDHGVRICSDELNHASIIDGARLSHAEVAVYRHRDVEHLEELLREATGPALVVTEVVFSMDGDIAPVRDIAAACRRHGALLVLDEAHVVFSPYVEQDLEGVDILHVGTLSKTLGSLGGFVAGRRAFVDLLVNRAQSYIFSTAPTPPDAAAALAALRLLSTPEGERLRTRLATHIEHVAPGHRSPIIPIMLGSDERAVKASGRAPRPRRVGPAVRPPVVAPGTARLRVTLSAAHSADQIRCSSRRSAPCPPCRAARRRRSGRRGRAAPACRSGLRSCSRRDEDDLSQLAALGEARVGLGGPVHGHGRLQHHAHPAGSEQRHHVVFDGAGDGGLVDEGAGAQRGAADAQSLLHEREQVDLDRAPPPTPMTATPSGDGHGPEHTGETGRAHELEGHVEGPETERLVGARRPRLRRWRRRRVAGRGAPRPRSGAGRHGQLYSGTPTPPAAPVTRTRSPTASSHWVKRAS